MHSFRWRRLLSWAVVILLGFGFVWVLPIPVIMHLVDNQVLEGMLCTLCGIALIGHQWINALDIWPTWLERAFDRLVDRIYA